MRPSTSWEELLTKDENGDDDLFATAILDEVSVRLLKFGDSTPRATATSSLHSLTGLDPLYLIPALKELAQPENATYSAAASSALFILQQPRRVSAAQERSKLPVEHPLDFDWRFDAGTRKKLIGSILSGQPGRVLLLGCPTLAADPKLQDVPVMLVDDNPALAPNQFPLGPRVVRTDLLRQPILTNVADFSYAVADPPFYREHLVAFLHAAAHALLVGGRLQLVLPGRWARPTAVADAQAAIACAEALGFQLRRIDPDAARYVMPAFEQAAYERLGAPGVPLRWRTADVAHFDLERRTSVPLPPSTGDRQLWHEQQLDERRWRVRVDPSEAPQLDALPELLMQERRLLTVSRRDKARLGANVLTDDNRAFVSRHPSLLLKILRSLASNEDAGHAVARVLGRPLSTIEQGQLGGIASLIQGGVP